MHINLLISILIIQSFFPLSNAFANNGLTGGVEVGHGIFWAYGLVFAALIGFIIYRRWDRRRGRPKQRSLRLQLKELNRALDTCLMQIQNADVYPNECGLSMAQRQENMNSVKSIQVKIDRAEELLAAT